MTQALNTRNTTIRMLPPALINRIAAGEVVERPSSVVKELVENALDAGASHIDIAAWAGGRNIRIADNGSGMSPENAALAFYNHATSKIENADDLDRIDTLGFRGEALASIGSISKLTCLTRTADASEGLRITLDESTGEPKVVPAGCAPGTIMEIEDLFYNTPARLKFLKRPQTELSHIEETVQFLALSHPEVRFTLALNEKVTLQTTGSGALKKTLDEIFNLQKENIKLVPITFDDPISGLTLAGFISEPGVMKSSKRWMMAFVNNRHVRCAVIQKAIAAAYESLLPHGRFPFCTLFLGIPPKDVDVNVHPAKREVRYTASGTVFGFVKGGMRRAMETHGLRLESTAPFAANPLNSDFQPTSNESANPSGAFSNLVHSPASDAGLSYEPGTTQAFQTPRYSNPQGMIKPFGSPNPLQTQAALSFYEGTEATTPYSISAHEPQITPTPETTEQGSLLAAMQGTDDARFKVIGQLFNTYILLETTQGLMVVDQHIASERTFFESLSRNLLDVEPTVQHLLTTKPLTISPVQKDLLTQEQASFARLGFLYTLDPDAAVVHLTGYPLVYEGRDGVFKGGGLFENLLHQLEETGDMKLDLDLLIATLSCHTAVRAGDPLLTHEMTTIIQRWLECKLPWTCPHGRPIAHTISKSEMNHFFLRPSLPVNA